MQQHPPVSAGSLLRRALFQLRPFAPITDIRNCTANKADVSDDPVVSGICHRRRISTRPQAQLESRDRGAGRPPTTQQCRRGKVSSEEGRPDHRTRGAARGRRERARRAQDGACEARCGGRAAEEAARHEGGPGVSWGVACMHVMCQRRFFPGFLLCFRPLDIDVARRGLLCFGRCRLCLISWVHIISAKLISS